MEVPTLESNNLRELEAQRAAADALRPERKRLAGIIAAPPRNFAMEIAQAQDILDRWRVSQGVETDKPDIGPADKTYKAFRRVKEKNDAAGAEFRKVEAKVIEFKKSRCCPHCLADGEGWKAKKNAVLLAELKTAAKVYEPVNDEFEKIAASYKQVHADYQKQLRAHKAWNEAQPHIKAIEAHIAGVRAEQQASVGAKERAQVELERILAMPDPTDAELAEARMEAMEVQKI